MRKITKYLIGIILIYIVITAFHQIYVRKFFYTINYIHSRFPKTENLPLEEYSFKDSFKIRNNNLIYIEEKFSSQDSSLIYSNYIYRSLRPVLLTDTINSNLTIFPFKTTNVKVYESLEPRNLTDNIFNIYSESFEIGAFNLKLEKNVSSNKTLEELSFKINGEVISSLDTLEGRFQSKLINADKIYFRLNNEDFDFLEIKRNNLGINLNVTFYQDDEIFYLILFNSRNKDIEINKVQEYLSFW